MSASEVEFASGTRRSFLETLWRTGLASAAGSAWPLRAVLAQQVPAERLLVHSARPQDIETPPHLLTSWITPNDLFYTRSHFYTPSIQENLWKLVIDGEVETPLTLTLQDLKSLESRTTVVTVECAGNGRAFFQPPVPGVQWEKGAVGTAKWTGIRLTDLLHRARPNSNGRHVWLDGADVGVGRAPDFVRNVPIEKATDADTLLAYEMNDQPLPIAHGFPLRAIVPGWEGAYCVKWLTHIRVSDHEYDGAFVQAAYRYPRRPVAPGTLVAAAETVPLRGLAVKSLITSHAPNSVVPIGAVKISGVAWAGEMEVSRVGLSMDGGGTWAPARLGADRARYAWREFEYAWRPREPGSYLVLSRATDTRGRTQPLVADWNPGGYLWNAIDQVRLNVISR